MTNKIIVKNAHMNNLKNINVEIPKHKLVAFTGVSGSGKSSLLFDTIFTEAQRQLIETFSSFARTRMPKLSRPAVEEILYLSTAIVIDQKRLGNNLRSTVGTVTEINTYLRLIYSRIANPQIGPSFLFSFNHPDGMCPYCHGLGKLAKVDTHLFFDQNKSLREGAINYPHYKVNGFLWKELIQSDLFDPDKKLSDYSEDELNCLLYSEPIEIKDSKVKFGYNRNFEGLIRKLEKSANTKAEDEVPEDEKNAYDRFFIHSECDHCHGLRLNERALSVKINGLNIAQLCALELKDCLCFVQNLNDERISPVKRKVELLLQHLIDIGVAYLTLDRNVSSLSGGEAQRVKLAKQLDCNLVDLLYIMDEPSMGLHPRDTDRLMDLLRKLRDNGNSVLIVEHDPDIIRSSEWIIDVGPRAGKYGGEIVFSGTPEQMKTADTLTANMLFQKSERTYQRKSWNDYFLIQNAKAHNLKNLTVKIPKGVLTCITGVAGSGKSSLIHECFVKDYPQALVINQQAIGKSSRATIATYTGVFDLIRKTFADALHLDASLFSFNSKGACPKCKGSGELSYDMHFLDSVKTICDECEGKRYHSEVLDYRCEGQNIADVLEMNADQALEFFHDKKIKKHLLLLKQVGLDYLKLGQTLSSLSGGEAQRLKIAAELHNDAQIYVMDEPTTGLHMSDIHNFYQIVQKLVQNNNTVIIIEHNLDLVKYADWIIDMGPEGGEDGGQILFEGTPEDLLNCSNSFTAQYLKKMI